MLDLTNVPLILHNGALALTIRDGEIHFHHHLASAAARRAVTIIERHGCQPMVYENLFRGGGIVTGHTSRDSAYTRRYLATKTHFDRVDDVASAIVEDPIQLAVADDNDRIAPLLSDLSRGPWTAVTSMSTAIPDARFLEVLSPRASKGIAAAILAKRFGVAPSHVLAIGDNYNDVDLLAFAGIGVAMGNAPDDVRALADWVAPTVDEDGAAIAIERFALATTNRGVPARAGDWSG